MARKEVLRKQSETEKLAKKLESKDSTKPEIDRVPRKWLKELSSVANVVVARCSRILALSTEELQQCFEEEVPLSKEDPNKYARSLLEYCCFKALMVATQAAGYLSDKHFRRLTFDMMLAWEAPGAVGKQIKKEPAKWNTGIDEGLGDEDDAIVPYSTLVPLLVDFESTVGKPAFVCLGPAISGVADIMNVHCQFDALARPLGGRLPFWVYDKFLIELEKAVEVMKNHAADSSLNSLVLRKDEHIIEVDGSVICRLFYQHIMVSTSPGRLILTDHSLYFEPTESAGVMPYDEFKKFDLEADLQQLVKPIKTGPWGAHLFNNAISYESIVNPGQVILEFPEFMGSSRRNYWLLIIREVIAAHQFIRRFQLECTGQVEVISRAVLGISRLRATRETLRAFPFQPESLLCFSVAKELPGGDVVFAILARTLQSKLERTCDEGNKMNRGWTYARSAVSTLCQLEFFNSQKTGKFLNAAVLVGEFSVDDVTPITLAVEQLFTKCRNVEDLSETLFWEKFDSIGTNMVILQVLVDPLKPIVSWINALLSWEQPSKTIFFILFGSCIIMGDLLQYVFPLFLLGLAAFIIFFKQAGEGPFSGEVKVESPPSEITPEQLLKLQQVISQLEELLKTSSIVLRKIRALFYSVVPQATDQVILSCIILTFIFTALPMKLILLLIFWLAFTRQLPLCQDTTQCFRRRFKKWWFHIPAVPVRFVNRTSHCTRNEVRPLWWLFIS